MAVVAFTTRANLVAGNVENIADVTSCLDALLAGVNGLEYANFAAQQAWQTIALPVGWASPLLSYYKDALGQVHLRGDALSSGATNITGGATLATLPAGYRPGVTVSFPLAFPLEPTVANVVQVTTAGVVSILGTPAVGGHTVSFGAARFRAEN